MRLPFRHTSKWSLLEDLHFHRLPYEGSVLLFELHSIKMVGEEGVAPPTPIKVVFYRHVCPTDIHISPIWRK